MFRNKIGILGTGAVGSTIGSKLAELGYEVMMGSRSATSENVLAFVERNAGRKAFAGTFANTAVFGDIIFNCTAGAAVMEVLNLAGLSNFNHKILVDVSNPLDFSKGMPPSLFVVNTNSLGEDIQSLLPDTMVVKSLNTMWCGVMVNPELINGGDHNVFMCGNVASSKIEVAEILKSFGWLDENIKDLGDITKARATEMYLPLWLSIFGLDKNAAFNIKIVR